MDVALHNVALWAQPRGVRVQAAPRGAVVKGVVLAIALQLFLAWPFLAHFPASYLGAAFEFSRVFMYKWTVNWKMIPEAAFLSPYFAKGLLLAHAAILLAFMHSKWLKGASVAIITDFSVDRRRQAMHPRDIAAAVLTGNFIGIVCARSLHYQFYSWYFHSVPLLLWLTPLPTPLRIVVFFLTELCWNVYPATAVSSSVLLTCHALLLCGLWLHRAAGVARLKKTT